MDSSNQGMAVLTTAGQGHGDAAVCGRSLTWEVGALYGDGYIVRPNVRVEELRQRSEAQRNDTGK
jgi:hypothetical protein